MPLSVSIQGLKIDSIRSHHKSNKSTKLSRIIRKTRNEHSNRSPLKIRWNIRRSTTQEREREKKEATHVYTLIDLSELVHNAQQIRQVDKASYSLFGIVERREPQATASPTEKKRRKSPRERERESLLQRFLASRLLYLS